ncbi:MurR/RpiR family transcriptional regulator [Pediococcus stilesii]|uniref:MurR/RpiR family transcriptional regulator n=1 Tax=Pediococcus stilesii TaxID=331679 RepID=A0A5R9BT33_9LACO|nr:MurR/RpiR family transcriptional regulator [Pediococcus stilesii]TLQ03866.1 MurR/RpiR family transcriptional regulator [Pediococcus stilesii]
MKSILFTLNNKLESFSKSERKVAQFIIDHPQDTIQMSADEISHRAQVSAATVVRLAKEVCEDGLPGLKIRLSAEVKLDDTLFTEVDPSDDLETMKHKMEFRISHAIGQTNQVLSTDAVQNAAEIIDKADNIYAYGLGASNLVASDFQQKFIRVGKPVAQTLDTHLIAVGMIETNSALLIISNSGETSEGLRLANAAKSLGVPVITITHAPDSAIAKKSTIILTHDDSGESGTLRTAATTSLMAQLYVVDLLYYTYITKNFDSNATRLAESKKIISENFDQ